MAFAFLPGGPVAAQGERPPPEVEVAVPVRQSVTDYDVYTGRIEAVESVDIRARVSGFLREIRFEEGGLVEAGDVLFVLDKRRPLAGIARLEAAKALAEAQLRLTDAELARADELLARAAISQAERDRRLAEQAGAVATLEGAEADLDIAAIDLDDTDIRAPFAGRVGAAMVDVGALIDGGSGQGTLLTDIVSIDPVEIVFDASESDYLAYVRLDLAGQASSSRSAPAEIDLRLPDEDDWSRTGRIDFIDNRIDAASGTIRVRASIPNGDGLLAPGLFAAVRVPRFGPYEAMLVPDAAVLTDQAGRVVYVVGPDDAVAARTVETGQLVDGLRVIRSGLEADERVILTNLMAVRPGAPVVPREAGSQDAAAGEAGQ